MGDLPNWLKALIVVFFLVIGAYVVWETTVSVDIKVGRVTETTEVASDGLATASGGVANFSSGSGPVNTQIPIISWNVGESANTNIEGQTVSVSTGQWTDTPTSFAYQWQDCNSDASTCVNISGETEPIYTFHKDDIGDYVRADVTATNSNGSTTEHTILTGQITSSGGVTYYVANGGSDSNTGTDKSAPWAHAPGMTGCTGNCSGHTARAGDQIILKGGDSWDSNASNGTTGLPWNWSQSGTADHQDYVGVDRTWYTGSNWSRPIINGDNALSTGSPAACTVPLTTTYPFRLTGSRTTIDGLEFKGFCFTNDCALDAQRNVTGMGGTYNKFINFYFHGWTATSGSPQCAQNLALNNGSSGSSATYNEFAYDIWDGIDSTSRSGTTLYGDCYDFNHNYVRYVNNTVCNDPHIVDDNVLEYVNADLSGGTDHGNTFEANSESPSDNIYYNNVLRHDGNVAGVVNLWIAPRAGYHDYVYNNVIYDINGGSGANFLDCDGCNGLANFLNNTAQSNSNIATDHWGTVENNNFIIASGNTPPFSGVVDNAITNYQATPTSEAHGGDGYTFGNQYAPTIAYHPTSGYGTNRTDLCASLPNYCNDTTLGVGLNTSGGTDTLTFPARYAQSRSIAGAWDAGAYNSP